MKSTDKLLKHFSSPTFKDSWFFSFEGIEGAGKSLQIRKLQESLNGRGYQVKIYREPGSTTFGEGLREAILLSNEPLHPMAEALLFASARAQLLHQIILKDLKTPKTIVICDRYIDSSLAYQGQARKLGIESILEIHKTAPLNILPHKTFYLKISLDCSLQRQSLRNQNKDYFEKEGRDFYEDLIVGYNKSAELFSQRVQVIDGENSPEEVSNDVLKIALDCIGRPA